MPLLIEIKRGYPYGSIEKRLMKLLKKYSGEYAVQSFDPLIVLWFRLFAPKVARGQLVTRGDTGSFKDDKLAKLSAQKFIWKYVSKPDFLSFDLKSIDMEDIYIAKELGCKIFVWTANTKKLRESSAEFADHVISEWKRTIE